MITTLTPNPALDLTYTVPSLVPHTTHRVHSPRHRAGGKGLNVSRVLHQLGHPTLAVAAVGGPTGTMFREELESSGIPHALVVVTVPTRCTVAVVSMADGDTTMFNEQGYDPGLDGHMRLRQLLERELAHTAVLVVSGSMPSGSPDGTLAGLIGLARDRGTPVVVDTSGSALIEAASAGATMLKPNASEIVEATGIPDPLRAAKALRDAGAERVVVSLGADGMLAVDVHGTWSARPARAVQGNPTGAGDAAVAALAHAVQDGMAVPDALREAVALSAAAVLAPLAGEADSGALDDLRAAVTVRRVDWPD
ncbi:1-phosphofructokinase family hexose kinase [Streptomyces sp. NPDC094149]|uniref:1-phosphofructokinase family hexose kinase n=1 Tax=Streptomyces sp. NPDC094149 TaxID=3155079 RepID=UPI003318A4AF